MRSVEVLFAPAEFAALGRRDLSGSVCVVFDILRATSTMVTALAAGAEAIIPVGEIHEALSLKRERPDILLAGEREGLRIHAGLTGGVEFDLGNSPREFTTQAVGGRVIAMTTTNGTRALRACHGAAAVMVGSFLNMGAVAGWIAAQRPPNLLLVCSGTHDQASYEDTVAAGALCEVMAGEADIEFSDSAWMARQVFQAVRDDLQGAMKHSRNGRRLLSLPDLRDDVPVCLARDRHDLLAAMQHDGSVRRIRQSSTR